MAVDRTKGSQLAVLGAIVAVVIGVLASSMYNPCLTEEEAAAAFSAAQVGDTIVHPLVSYSTYPLSHLKPVMLHHALFCSSNLTHAQHVRVLCVPVRCPYQADGHVTRNWVYKNTWLVILMSYPLLLIVIPFNSVTGFGWGMILFALTFLAFVPSLPSIDFAAGLFIVFTILFFVFVLCAAFRDDIEGFILRCFLG